MEILDYVHVRLWRFYLSTVVWYKYTMAMNIKNPETYRLAQELAAKMGTSLTEAVTQAVREKLWEFERDQRMKRALATAKDASARMPDEFKKSNPDNELYDEFGLPK